MDAVGEIEQAGIDRRKDMFENKTETQAKEEILVMVKEYCETFHKKNEYA